MLPIDHRTLRFEHQERIDRAARKRLGQELAMASRRGRFHRAGQHLVLAGRGATETTKVLLRRLGAVGSILRRRIA